MHCKGERTRCGLEPGLRLISLPVRRGETRFRVDGEEWRCTDEADFGGVLMNGARPRADEEAQGLC